MVPSTDELQNSRAFIAKLPTSNRDPAQRRGLSFAVQQLRRAVK